MKVTKQLLITMVTVILLMGEIAYAGFGKAPDEGGSGGYHQEY